ncbi:MAG: hypothetical protein ACJAV1_001516 [Paraglaciecola sp.]|jgi:hypothetical protein
MKIKKTLLSLAAVITTFSSAAAANGYWEYVKVCDYEQVEVQQPKTSCVYSGIITSIGASYSGISYFVNPIVNGHITCYPRQYASESRSEYNPSTQEWERVSYSGIVPLTYQGQYFVATTETVKVEGSCRTERVWIELCNNCQIP